jgi:hypothetical protein
VAKIETMSLDIKKVDRRYTGYPDFKYLISVNAPYNLFKNRAPDNLFFEWREWCWQTWGASKEVDEWITDKNFNIQNIVLNTANTTPKSQNKHWCWKHDRDAKNRIYLASDQELVLFKLRWE